eukprot:TRINITY_DN11458_c0_g1_i1.p1 TRINITY_DN11458_c0_g1~~TRINITY_DN11458_c0_g1_i1.p1  ORF type:complete len:422 (+),score=115.38 TRINITY_DN11458_c0_g1_i1:83-1348(+)
MADVTETLPSNRPIAYLFKIVLAAWICGALYAFWFAPYLTTEEIERIALTFFVWHLLLLCATKDPGYVTEANAGYYEALYGLDDKGDIRRSGVSLANPQRRVARYDHSNFFLGVDVGAGNYFWFNAWMWWTVFAVCYAWYLGVWVLAGSRDLYSNRPGYFPPLLWELCVMFALCVECYLRIVAYGLYSLFCAAWRAMFFDHPYFVTKADAWDNLLWLVFYGPGSMGVTLMYYGAGYLFLFVLECFCAATGNLTLQEERLWLKKTVITRAFFRSMTGLMFVMNQEVVGALAGQDLYTEMCVYDPLTEQKPEGTHYCDTTPWRLFNLGGTLPSDPSPNDLGSRCRNLYAMYFGTGNAAYLKTTCTLPIEMGSRKTTMQEKVEIMIDEVEQKQAREIGQNARCREECASARQRSSSRPGSDRAE